MTILADMPRWLRVGGVTGWLALGVTGAGRDHLGSVLHETLVTPFLFAVVLAILFTPAVNWLTQRRVPRFAAAVLVLLGLVVVAVVSTIAVIRGIAEQAPEIGEVLSSAADEAEAWLTSAGISPPTASDLTSAALNAGESVTITLVSGIFAGLGALSSILFMLLHGARDRTWFVRHSGLSARTIEPVVDDAASAISGISGGPPFSRSPTPSR